MTATKNRSANPRALANPKVSGIGAKRRSEYFHRLFAPSHGVVVLAGYGIRVHVDRGHLTVEDGAGSDRRKGRFPRVHHGLRRVVVVGSDGMVSLSAIRWMADQKIAFAMLERDGSTLVSTGPVALSDTRIRRAQALIQNHPYGVEIARELIRRKLAGQECLIREQLHSQEDADEIAKWLRQLPTASTLDEIRRFEALGASAFWSAWQNIAITFPASELSKVPDHWQRFDGRRSPLTLNARKATNPVNAILNYLYTLLESETRLAIQALGLDPGFGLLHFDSAVRDSLVYDLMEPIRPKVDAYVLNWISHTPLRRSSFFEQPDGTCRLMAAMTMQLAETSSTWSREVAPVAEWFVQQLCSRMLEHRNVRGPGTRLTQQRRRVAKGTLVPSTHSTPTPRSFCQTCGASISDGRRYCGPCGTAASTEAIRVANSASKAPPALRKRAATMAAHRIAERRWSPSDLPEWLTEEVYSSRIQPLLNRLARKVIERSLELSPYYARGIATGRVIPHKRHWATLAELVDVRPPVVGT